MTIVVINGVASYYCHCCLFLRSANLFKSLYAHVHTFVHTYSFRPKTAALCCLLFLNCQRLQRFVANVFYKRRCRCRCCHCACQFVFVSLVTRAFAFIEFIEIKLYWIFSASMLTQLMRSHDTRKNQQRQHALQQPRQHSAKSQNSTTAAGMRRNSMGIFCNLKLLYKKLSIYALLAFIFH